jgi:hypothetical protein
MHQLKMTSVRADNLNRTRPTGCTRVRTVNSTTHLRWACVFVLLVACCTVDAFQMCGERLAKLILQTCPCGVRHPRGANAVTRRTQRAVGGNDVVSSESHRISLLITHLSVQIRSHHGYTMNIGSGGRGTTRPASSMCAATKNSATSKSYDRCACRRVWPPRSIAPPLASFPLCV